MIRANRTIVLYLYVGNEWRVPLDMLSPFFVHELVPRFRYASVEFGHRRPLNSSLDAQLDKQHPMKLLLHTLLQRKR